MGSQVLQKPLNPKAVKAANTKVSLANTPAQKSAWVAEYKAALKKINNLNCAGSNANNKKGNLKATQTCTKPGCLITKLTIDGIHNSKRGFKLELPAPKLAKGSVPPVKKDFMQVLGGFSEKTAAELKIQYVGSCQNGVKNCPNVNIAGGKIYETFTDKTKKFKVMSAHPATATSFADNLIPFSFFTKNLLFPSNAPRQTYTISTMGCPTHNAMDANIEVITPVGWEGKFSWGWKKETWKKNQLKLKKNERTFNFGVEISGNYETRKFKVDAKWEKNAKPGNIVESVLGMADTMLEKMSIFDEMNKHARKSRGLTMDMAPDIKVEIKWPNFEVSGGVKNVEVSGNYMVETEGNVKLEANPFIGASIKTDILDWIAAAWPPILKFKKMAAEGVDTEYFGAKAVIEVLFGIEGLAKGNIEVKYNPQAWSVAGEIAGELSFILEGKVYAEGRVWRLYIGAGATLAAKSAENKSENPGLRIKIGAEKNNDDIKLVGNVRFTGITIYGAYYVHYGIKSVKTTETKPKNSSRGLKEETKTEEISKLEEKNLKEVWQMCKPVLLLGNE